MGLKNLCILCPNDAVEEVRAKAFGLFGPDTLKIDVGPDANTCTHKFCFMKLTPELHAHIMSKRVLTEMAEMNADDFLKSKGLVKCAPVVTSPAIASFRNKQQVRVMGGKKAKLGKKK